MIRRIRTSWQIFSSGRPGVRFRERYRLRQSRGGLYPARPLYLTEDTIFISSAPC